jgi:ABC-type branched-subunit amino acid transport system substrate-binding protein
MTMTNKVFKSALALMIFFLFMAGPAAAQLPSGVTDDEIHIGQWGPQTGPAAPWGAVARGAGVLFDMINADGGINGRKIVYHMFDDQYNPARTKAGVKELQEKEPGVFAWTGGVGTAPGLAVKDYLMDNKIPWVGPSAGSLHWITPPEKYLFAVYPLYYTEAKVLTRYVVQEENIKKIAVLYANDEYGKNGLKGAKEELDKLGLEPVIEIPVGRADRDLKSHILKLKNSGAEAVLMWVNPTHAVITVKTAAAMKYEPQWVTSSTLSDAPLMMKITGGLWKNIIFANFLQMPDADTPLMNEYRQAFEKYAQKGERWGVFFLAGIGFAEPLVEALRRVPHEELTRENLVLALETLDCFQGIMGSITFGPDRRQGQKTVYVAKTDETGEKVIKLTDWQGAE